MTLGVVLEGGACFCAFQAGAIDELHRHGIKFDHVTGASAGALNGCAIVAGRIDSLLPIWRGLAGTRVVNLRPSWLLRERSCFTMSQVTIDIIRSNFPIEVLRASAIDFAIVATRLARGMLPKRVVYTNRDQVDLEAVLRASNRIPVIHPRAISIDGVPHIDGGFLDNVPIDVPLASGCKRVLAIVNNRWGKVVRRAYWPVPEPIEPYGGRVVVLYPHRPLPMKVPFDFRRDHIEESIRIGQDAARALLDSGALS